MMTIRWRGVASALCFVLFASQIARGQEYKIKLRHAAQVGDSYPYLAEGSMERHVVSTNPGQPPTSVDQKMTAELSGTLKVLEVDQKGNASKISLTVIKCLFADDSDGLGVRTQTPYFAPAP